MRYLIVLLALFAIEAQAVEFTSFDMYSQKEACVIATEKADYITNHAALNKCSCARQGIFWKCTVTKKTTITKHKACKR